MGIIIQLSQQYYIHNTTSMVMGGSMLVGTVLLPTVTKLYEKKRKRKKENLRQKKYRAYLDKMAAKINDESQLQEEILNENFATIQECENRIIEKNRNLWERGYGQNDFLRVRLGYGEGNLNAEISYSDRHFSLDDDNLREELYSLCESDKTLHNIPITYSMFENYISGIIGQKKQVIEFAKGLIIQLAALYSYDEVKFVCIYDESEKEEFEFVKWIPHVWSDDKNFRFIARNANEVKEISAYFENIIEEREHINESEINAIKPYYIIFDISKNLGIRTEVIKKILIMEKRINISIVTFFEELKDLPKECSMIVSLDGNTGKLFDKNDISGNSISFVPDIYVTKDPLDMSVKLANTILDNTISNAKLPSVITFMQLFGVGKVEHLNVLTRWKENNPTEMITSANLKVEKNEIYDNNVAAGLVISQAPQAGSSQKGGTKILLTVSLGKQPVTVKFNSLGGTCPESERTVYYTETYGELPVPTMQYHKFLGWYTAEKSGSQVEADTKVNNVNSQTLYARWERIYVRVAFDANGGKVGTSSTNIAMGEKYSLPTPERKYYSFDGWYTEKNGGTKVTSSDVMSTGERHTLYAHWTVKSVTVTYDAGSGSITGDANVKYNLGTEYGKKLATRTGYTFMGWYTKANGSGTKVLKTDIVTDEKEHTLYAYWSNKAITIALDPRSGTLSERSIKAEYDKEYGTLPTPKRKGYTFEGWYTSASGGDRVTESSVCKDEKDATLYARWANQQFNVYFNSNGGSCSTNNKTVTYNNSYGDLPSATRTGYTFAGWYTESSGGRNVNQNTTYTDINDTTLYAHWNKNSYTVTFDANGGSCSTGRITVKYDDSYGGLPTPSYFRHTFAGWYTSRSGGSKIESGSIFRETRNITLYAHWNDIPVTAINGDFSDKTFGVGETRNPGASVSPSSATNTTITWRSNNTNVAKVDGNGNITGISKGTATITASCGGVSRNITVYIKNVVYGYDLSQGSINFGAYMYAPQNNWINGGKPGYQHIHIEFGTKNTVKDGNSVIFYSRRDVGMFGIFIENKKLVVAEVKDGNGHYNLCRTNITLQPNTKYRIEVDPSGTYNIVQNGQLVETGHFPDFRFIVGGSGVTSIPGAYTVMGSVESWYGGAYEGSPAADIYIYKIDSEAGFTHYVREHGSHPGHAGATHIEVTSNGVINRGGNKDEWVYCDTSVTGINSKAITRILVDY